MSCNQCLPNCARKMIRFIQLVLICGKEVVTDSSGRVLPPSQVTQQTIKREHVAFLLHTQDLKKIGQLDTQCYQIASPSCSIYSALVQKLKKRGWMPPYSLQ